VTTIVPTTTVQRKPLKDKKAIMPITPAVHTTSALHAAHRTTMATVRNADTLTSIRDGWERIIKYNHYLLISIIPIQFYYQTTFLDYILDL